jgi:hypothetical protein
VPPFPQKSDISGASIRIWDDRIDADSHLPTRRSKRRDDWIMHSIALTQLREKKNWLPWIQRGEAVELRGRTTVIGYIVPPNWRVPERFQKRADELDHAER